MSSTSNTGGVGTMDILAAAFFVVAGAWLLVALVYSTLVLIFLRLRARGELGNIYEEDFGRLYLCGRRGEEGGCYIPLGRIFRRYIAHLQYDANGTGEGVAAAPVRFMTRDERRTAMETLLIEQSGKPTKQQPECDNTKTASNKSTKSNPKQILKAETRDTDLGDIEQGSRAADSSASTSSGADYGDDYTCQDEPLCCICLGEYDEHEPPLAVNTCSHEFHRDCLMDWLQRQANTDCPCCRSQMVSEDAVWEVVQKNRKERKKQMRRLRKQQQRQQRRNSGDSLQQEQEEQDVSATADPTERLEDEEEALQEIHVSVAPALQVAHGDNEGDDDEDDDQPEQNQAGDDEDVEAGVAQDAIPTERTSQAEV